MSSQDVYQGCACRDCFELCIGRIGTFCVDCVHAGCPDRPHATDRECLAPGAYGGDPDDTLDASSTEPRSPV